MRGPTLLALGFALTCANILHAQQARKTAPPRSLELALSEETAQIRYLDSTTIAGQANSEVAYALFLSEDRDVVGSAGVMMDTDLDFGPLEVKLGPQAYAGLLQDENNDVFALAIGAQLRFNLIPERDLALTGYAFYSPDVLTFGSADNLTDFMVRAEIRLGKRVEGFAGYRWFELDLLERQTRRLQNELFLGLSYELR
ncbi:MAG: hypothetical protein IRZ28_02415 [Steroidobacteraceae bacterium]|nr:hypothetical protein [Steroidobacteraceae bacterium]